MLSQNLEEQPIKEVWTAYAKTASEDIRNFLLVKFFHIVLYYAERIKTRLPDEVDVDDLKQAGTFGLMDAIDSFDLGRQVKFETYCQPRVRGAILDELRLMDWVPRLVRSRTSKVDAARRKLEMELGRPPDNKEIRQTLGLSEYEFEKLLSDSAPVGAVSLNRKWYETDSNKDVREVDMIEDGRQCNPIAEVQRRDLKNALLKGFTRTEQLIITLYYYEEMTMKEISGVLGVSESRISQVHTSIIGRLKSQLKLPDNRFMFDEK